MKMLRAPLLRRLLPYLLLIVTLAPLAGPYLQPDYQYADDLHAPYLRVIALRQAVAEGQIPPRWFVEFDGGYGSPYPSFYAMLFYDVAAIFNSIGLALGSAVELTAYLSIVLAGVAMFILARSLWGERSGVLAAALYTYAPYHLVDAYYRGAFSELASFAWFPLVVHTTYQWILTRRKKWLAFSALSIGGLILTHNLMPMLFLPVYMSLLGVVALFPGDRGSSRWPRLWALVLSCGLGLLSVAFFWLPIVLERNLLRLDFFLQYDYRGDFVGRGTLFAWASANPPYTSIGLILVVGAIIGVLVAFWPRTRSSHRLLALGALGAGFLCLFMANSRSGWIWAGLPLLKFVQFPWRFLAPASFSLALAAGPLPRISPNGLASWAIVVLLGVAIYLQTSPLVRIDHRIDGLALETMHQCEPVSETQDYRPLTSHTLFWRGTTPPAQEGDPLLLDPCSGRVTFSPEGSAQVLSSSSQGTRWDMLVGMDELTVVTIPQFYFPGWMAWIDGVPTPVSPSPGNGLLQVSVPPGQHALRLDYRDTNIRRAANYLSVAGGLILAWVIWSDLRKKERRSVV